MNLTATAVLLPPGEPVDNPDCGYRPAARYLDGPLAGTAARPLKRKDGPVHPLYRTADGKTTPGRPDGEHYLLLGQGWNQFYAFQPTPIAITPDNPAGGSNSVACTDCGWSRPALYHREPSAPGRPGGADNIDALIPEVRRHIQATGHRIRLVMTTWWPLEQSSMVIDRDGHGPWSVGAGATPTATSGSDR